MNLSVIFRYKKYEVKKRQEYKNISGLDISYDSYSDIRNEFISSLFLDLYFPFSFVLFLLLICFCTVGNHFDFYYF